MELCRVRDPGLARAITLRSEAGWALGALAALTLLRLALAACVPLAPDEAYYWVWSRSLAAGYPDHPFMVALWIRIGTALAGDGTIGVRLLGPISVAVSTLLLADAADRLLPGRKAGLRTAALLNATLLFGVGSILMTPDTPLLAFWTAALWALARLFDSGNQRWWLAIGLFAGMAMDSKYTAALLWLGVILWLLIIPSARAWLWRPWLWIGAALGFALFLPAVVWEANHDWASFARQGGRLGAWDPALALRFLAELVGGQVGLATPLVFACGAAGVVEATRQSWRTRDGAWTLLAAMTLPSVALFTQHALGDRVQGNWPAIIYPGAAIAAGALPQPIWQRLWLPAVVLGFGITLMVYIQASASILPLPIEFDPIARQLAGWDTLSAEINAVRLQTGDDYVAADQYGIAAELARNLPPGVTVVGAEPRWALTNLPRAEIAGRVGILVQSVNRGVETATGPWVSATPLATVPRRRDQDTIEDFRIYRVTARSNATEVVTLPRPR